MLNEFETKCLNNVNKILALDIRVTKNEEIVELIKSDYESFRPSVEKIDQIFEWVQTMNTKRYKK